MLAVVVALLVVGGVARADALLDRLARGEPAAVAEVEATAGATPDVVLAAAHASDEALHDPARALRLYERVVRDAPDARAAVAAGKRAAELRVALGGSDGRAAAALAALVATADARPAVEVERELDAIGTPDAAAFHADWLRRSGKLDAAATQLEALVAKWPDLPQARVARRARVGVAIDRHAWSEAESLARALPVGDTLDALERDDLIAQAQRGRRRDRLFVMAAFALAAAFAAMLASVLTAARAAGRRPRFPVELIYLGPVVAVLIGVAFTAHRLIAPAVATISIGGLAFASLSGASLDLLRSTGRSIKLRAISHVAICALAVLCLVYIAMMRDGLLDTLLETVRFGPDG